MRHQINSFEFQCWLDELYEEDPLSVEHETRETLYDMWVEGYSQWEIAAILG